MILGEYQQKLTGKGRILLPIKMRQQIRGEEIVLSKGFDRCLFGYDKNQWETNAHRQLNNSSVVNVNDRDLRRYLFSGAAITALDSQGRFVIPSNLSNYAGIENQVTIVGAGDHFEIWEPSTWNKKVNEIENRSENFGLDN